MSTTATPAGQSRVTDILPISRDDAQAAGGYDLLDASAGFLDSHAALMASDLNPHAVAKGEIEIFNFKNFHDV